MTRQLLSDMSTIDDGAHGPESSEVVLELQEQIRELQARILQQQSQAGSTTRQAHSAGDPAAPTEISDESENHGRHIPQLTNDNVIPQVRYCNYSEFKNRCGGDDGLYAVEVLESGELLDQEIHDEIRLRERQHDSANSRAAKGKSGAGGKAGGRANKSQAAEKPQVRLTPSTSTPDDDDYVWTKRIRISSPAILKILAKIQVEQWSSRPRVYYRPFSSLVYFHPRMKEALKALEMRWGDGHGNPSGATTPSGTTDDGKTEPQRWTVDNCPAALLAMREYVRFFDEQIIREHTLFQDRDFKSPVASKEVWFYDLWYLFRTGEFVYRPLEGDLLSSGQRDLRIGKRVWRVYGIKPCDTPYKHTHTDHRQYEGQDPSDETANFIIKAYYLEFTGTEFVVMPKSFSIAPYKGPRQISALPIYPVRFANEWQDITEQSKETGKKVLRFLEVQHGSYNGWTVTRTPAGDPTTDVKGAILQNGEYINSEVMVDFSEAFQACPSWKPKKTILRPEATNQLAVLDTFSTLWWSDPERTKRWGDSTDLIPVRTGASTWEQNAFIQTDGLLKAMMKNDDDGKPTTRTVIDEHEENLMLVTGRVFGYVFQERKFVQLDVRRLQNALSNRDSLDSLRIHVKTKSAIQDSVRGHLVQRALEREEGGERRTLDLIQGKGEGLFVLLHGVPGVGKTATAEAIAQANCKALFKITCGDLGLTPGEVEVSLREIFRLAGLWDCILLLDEVDTFFSQRSKGDNAMNKNALVSVFLRILDYYTGILFLTTNRPGSLDEAFKSRIHHKLYYPPLSKQQTRDIWELNLRRLRQISTRQGDGDGVRTTFDIAYKDIMRFADSLFERNRHTRHPQWNGRQIRNAFQVARSLAYSDAMQNHPIGEPLSKLRPRLEVQHFLLVNEITESFEAYRRSVFAGLGDADLARELEQRDDDYEDPFNQSAPAVRPSNGHGEGGGSPPSRRRADGDHGPGAASGDFRHHGDSFQSQGQGRRAGSSGWLDGLAGPNAGSPQDTRYPDALGVGSRSPGPGAANPTFSQAQRPLYPTTTSAPAITLRGASPSGAPDYSGGRHPSPGPAPVGWPINTGSRSPRQGPSRAPNAFQFPSTRRSEADNFESFDETGRYDAASYDDVGNEYGQVETDWFDSQPRG